MRCGCAQERLQLLSFIIVGGGPTGIEVAAELHDMVVDDLRRIYPDLIRRAHGWSAESRVWAFCVVCNSRHNSGLTIQTAWR